MVVRGGNGFWSMSAWRFIIRTGRGGNSTAAEKKRGGGGRRADVMQPLAAMEPAQQVNSPLSNCGYKKWILNSATDSWLFSPAFGVF